MNHNHFTHPGEGYWQRISDQDDIVNILTNLRVEQKNVKNVSNRCVDVIVKPFEM